MKSNCLKLQVCLDKEFIVEPSEDLSVGCVK